MSESAGSGVEPVSARTGSRASNVRNLAAPPRRSFAPRLGTYLQCSAQAIEYALREQGTAAENARRLGDVLLESRAVSREDLLASIQAQRIDRLRACPLFSGLNQEELVALSAGFEEYSVPAGHQFIAQDSPEPYVYVLASGRLEVFRAAGDGEETKLSSIMPGEPIGEMGYFADGVRSASVRALEDSQLLRGHYDNLTGCFEANPALADAFVDVVSSRLRLANEFFQDTAYRLRSAERSLKHFNEFLDLSDAAELGAGIEGLMERLVNSASNIIDADRASLFLIDPVSGELWSKVAEGVEVKEIRVPGGTGVIGWVAEHRRVLNIPDAYADPRFNQEVDRKSGYRTRTILCAPIISLRGEVLGVVQVINKLAGVFSDDDEALLRAFAHQAAVAVENFNLYRRVMLNHRRMEVMLDISTSIHQTLDLGDLIHSIVTKTTEVLNCERGSLFVLDHESAELWSMEAHGYELREIRFPASTGLAGHVVSTGEVLTIHDAYKDPRFNREIDRRSGYRTRTVLCAPVYDRDGRIAGVTQAINKREGRFDEEDVELLRAVSSQIGVALENAKLHAGTVDMKNYLESVQQSISNSIVTLSKDFKIVTANKAAVNMFPQIKGDQPGREFRDLLAGGSEQVLELLERVHQTKSSVVEYDLELRAASGEDKTVNMSVVPLTDAEDEFQGLVAVLEDITSEKRVKSAFSHYLAPAVIEQLLADPARLSLGGEKREMTFLFTDIAGFTTLSEQIDPPILVTLLNEYLDHTCNVVLRHGGTIDKIVGDALHVMFNAPADQPDHAERAVRCAIDLDDFCQSFAAAQGAAGIDLGLTRIGVNTGPAVVGNFGGSDRFDYTAYGDSINTASRLEGVNRYLGTRVCVSEVTRRRCQDVFFRPVGRLALKGKSEAIQTYEPLSPELARSPGLRDYLQAYDRMEQRDAGAPELFRRLAARYPDDGLIACHAARLVRGESGSTIVLAEK